MLVIDYCEFYTYSVSKLMESVDDKVVAMNGMGIRGRKEDKMPNSYKNNEIEKNFFNFNFIQPIFYKLLTLVHLYVLISIS